MSRISYLPSPMVEEPHNRPTARCRPGGSPGHQDWVYSVCPLTIDGRDLLASRMGSADAGARPVGCQKSACSCDLGRWAAEGYRT